MTKRGEPLPIHHALNRPRAKLGLDLTAWMAIVLADLEKTATLLEGHLGISIGLRLLEKNAVYQFFSYLFNLEEWASADSLSADDGVDRQIVKSPIEWHSDHLTIGRRYVQMFSLKTTPEASRIGRGVKRAGGEHQAKADIDRTSLPATR